MSERKEPTVSSVLDDKEDLVGRRAKATQQMRRSATSQDSASAARGAQVTSRPTSRVAIKNENTTPPNERTGSSGFTWFVFLLTLCVGAATAYVFLQLDMTQKTIKDQRLRIVQLENKLAISDDSASQSLASVSAQVRELNSKSIQADSEIAKLWATRNVNRDGIKGAEEKIGSLDKKVTTLGKKFAGDVSKLQSEQKKLLSLQASLQDVKSAIDELQALERSVKSTRQTAAEQDILLRALREKLAVHTEQLKVLGSQANKGVSASNKFNALEQRVKETEEVITSLEAFRRTTNRELLQLKRP
ncbi:hypothetical protein ACVBE9_12060 [Eionea flava]